MWRLLAVVALASLATWQVQDWRMGEKLATQAKTFQEDMILITRAGAAQARLAMEDQQRKQMASAALDTRNTQEKADALADNKRLQEKYTASTDENSRLRGVVLAGYDRLRIAGSCSAVSGSVSNSTGAAGMGNGAAIELAPAAGRSVFDIREGIIKDQAALRALQEYVRTIIQ